MQKKIKEFPMLPEMHETLRRNIRSVLERGPRSAKDLSADVGISEKEVYGHLEHIKMSVSQSGLHFIVMPAKCKKCGFVFSKREKMKKPGKCPVCRGESIREPLYSIEKNG